MRKRTLFSSMFDPLLRPCSKFTCGPLAAQAPAVNSYRLSGITFRTCQSYGKVGGPAGITGWHAGTLQRRPPAAGSMQRRIKQNPPSQQVFESFRLS
jgi:hypothetical protein